MKTKLANLIKNKRKSLKLSQAALAEGICTQTIISRLEKAEVTPSVDIFFKIIKKLDISMEDVSEIFNINFSKDDTSISLYIKNVDEILYKKDYKTLSVLIKTVDVSKLDIQNRLFFEYLEAILEYHEDNQLDSSIEKLKKLSEKVEKGTLIYCRIFSTIGNFYTEKNDFKAAVFYFEKVLPFLSIIENTIFEQAFYYGLARSYGMNNQIDNAIKWNSLAISKLLEKKSFFKLGSQYLLQARILEEQKLYTNAIESCNKAISIFSIENDEYLKSYSLSYLSHLKEKINNEKI